MKQEAERPEPEESWMCRQFDQVHSQEISRNDRIFIQEISDPADLNIIEDEIEDSLGKCDDCDTEIFDEDELIEDMEGILCYDCYIKRCRRTWANAGKTLNGGSE